MSLVFVFMGLFADFLVFFLFLVLKRKRPASAGLRNYNSTFESREIRFCFDVYEKD